WSGRPICTARGALPAPANGRGDGMVPRKFAGVTRNAVDANMPQTDARNRPIRLGPITMNLHRKLLERAAANDPIRIGLIGAGKFGSMYLAQVPRMPGVHLVGIADLPPDQARTNLDRVGWQPGQAGATSGDEALRKGTTWITD